MPAENQALTETEDDKVGGIVPLGDASRRPARLPVVTAGIIVVNVAVFVLELWSRHGALVQGSASNRVSRWRLLERNRRSLTASRAATSALTFTTFS